MKNIIIGVAAILSISACSQTPKTQPMEEITSQNFVEKVLENVKHYEKEPVYWINIYKKADIEIYINDMPAYKSFDGRKFSTSTEINHLILNSGQQKLRYRIFSKEKEVYVGIEVTQMDNKGEMKVSDEKMVKNYEKTITMPASGIYEEEFTFQAEVPYQNKGWNDGQDLTKFDKKELESAVVAFYRKMWNIYNDKSRKEDQFPQIIKREIETSQSLYHSKSYIEEGLKEYLMPYDNKTFKLQPFEYYHLSLYAGGKVAALEQSSMDVRLKGNLAIWGKFQFEGEKSVRTYFPSLYLYIPPGKDLKDGLQIIR